MRLPGFLARVALSLPAVAIAGGSHYGLAPGTNAGFAGKVSEWPVPTPEFARDPAPGPDGNIYVTVMHGNRIARFDTKAKTFREWDLPPGARPHGLLVDRQGIVWYTGNGNGTIGRLDPATSKVIEYRTPSGGGGPHTLVMADDGHIWFTLQSGDKVARLDPASGRISEYRTSGGPYGITLDRDGRVWFCRMGADMLGRLDPRTGNVTDVVMPPGSRPRRMATAPDGSLWVTLYGSNRLVQVDTATSTITRDYALPSGRGGGAYAVTVDGAGMVWANEISTDTVVRLDPRSGDMRVIALPSKGVGIRKMIVDGTGRLWYMGSHNGRLGVVE